MLTASYVPAYVILSFWLSFGACYLVTCLVEQLRLTLLYENRSSSKRFHLLLMMGICIGGVGVWGMHFVGMASLRLTRANGEHVDFQFNTGVSMLSMICATVFSTVGVFVATGDPMFAKSKKEIIDAFLENASVLSISEALHISAVKIFRIICTRRLHRLLAGGVIAGGGICVMHYVGMQSMTFEGRIEWNYGIVVATVFIACGAASAAFWILFRLLSIFPKYESLRLASALLMAIAVTGMHYTGMVAASFYEDGRKMHAMVGSGTMTVTESLIGPIIAGVTVIWLMTLYVLVDLRAKLADKLTDKPTSVSIPSVSMREKACSPSSESRASIIAAERNSGDTSKSSREASNRIRLLPSLSPDRVSARTAARYADKQVHPEETIAQMPEVAEAEESRKSRAEDMLVPFDQPFSDGGLDLSPV